MSWQPASSPECRDEPSCDAVDTVIVPRARDLGGFQVRRVLPSPLRRMVGPFIFLDEMGPVDFPAGKGIDVRPHPHIGLATVTYLFSGLILHRDSLGTIQPIAPGDVNWMTAGRGIVHSERSDPEKRKQPDTLSGIQIWVALPERHEETEPAFTHTPAASLPFLEGDGVAMRVVAGELFGQVSPVRTMSELFYADARLSPDASLELTRDHEERALYVAEGEVEVSGKGFEAGRLLVFADRREVVIRARREARVLLLGGAPMDGPRHIWWNFVSSRKERIEEAKEQWKQRRFDQVVPGETEFIPLPEESGP